uniref:Protein S-acyltransferase 18 n=1 Tax=Tanacetum cinerariifolium TaxID=118510 RepID=A0A6L2JX40_TANCI|nr:protein S-acyltransferase 18 [Tanacetum cinerariifolium]
MALAGGHSARGYGATSGMAGTTIFWVVTMARGYGSAIPRALREMKESCNVSSCSPVGKDTSERIQKHEMIAGFAGSVRTYGSAALGKLFLFHVVLICKGMRTFYYIMAMKEENALMEEDMSEDYSDISSDEILDLDSPKKRFTICRERIPEAYIFSLKNCGLVLEHR